MIEIWRDIPGYEGFYQTSSLGRIRSLDRTVVYKDGRRAKVFGRLLTSSPGTHGYPMIDVWKDGKRRRVGVHVLVALTFLGPKPPGLEVCHCDGNRLNSAPDNLRYDTRSANQLDRAAHGTDNRGEKNGQSRLKHSDVVEIHRLLAEGASQRKLSDRFGVTQSTISAIALGKIWGWVSV